MEFNLEDICYRQRLFESTLKSSFMRKITKYKNILLKNGIHLAEDSVDGCDSSSLKHSQSFDDHIELVLGQQSESPNARKTMWKIGSRVSTLKLFQWIFQVVQRTKAARVLKHLDGVSVDDLERTLLIVGKEISVSYEYQLMMLEGDLEVIKLSQHASACMITYLNSKEASFLPENLLQAVLEIKPCNGRNKDILKTRAVVYNNVPVCLKWRLSQVLKQTGLRIFVKTTISTQQLCGISLMKNKETIEDAINATDQEEDENCSRSCDNSIENDNGTEESKNKLNEHSKETNIQEKNNDNDNKVDLHETSQNNEELESDKIVDDIKDKPTAVFRKLNVIDMDYENGVMAVTEHSVIASEFSAVDNETSDNVDGDSTFIDEDLNSEGEMISEINDDYVEISKLHMEVDSKDVAIVKPVSEVNDERFEMPKTISEMKTEVDKLTCDLVNNSSLRPNDLNVNDTFCFRRQNRGHNCDCKNKICSKDLSYGDDKFTQASNLICSPCKSNTELNCENGKCNVVKKEATTADEDDTIDEANIHDKFKGAIVTDTNVLPTNENLNISTVITNCHTGVTNVHACTYTGSPTDISNENRSLNYIPNIHSNTSTDSDVSLPCDWNTPNEHLKTSSGETSESVYTSANDKSDSSENLPCKNNVPNAHSKTSTNHKSDSAKSLQNDSKMHESNSEAKTCQNFLSDQGIYKFYGCFTPYGAKCRPELYGYRGPLHVWNETECTYTLIYNDTVTVLKSHNREIVRDYTDCHQSYIPQTTCSHVRD
ncbi:hypothetical protein ACF0H5_015333 [Mactra antiquata]